MVLEFLTRFARVIKASAANRPVTVCYSSHNAALLRFVTNELLARKPDGVRVLTGLLPVRFGQSERM